MTKLDKVLSNAVKQYGDGVVWKVDDLPDYKVIPTGLMALNRALGTGGWPKGHYSEVFGPDRAGKSTLAFASLGQCARLGEEALYICTEHKVDAPYMRRCIEAQGGNIDLCTVILAPTGESALQILLNATGSAGLIVLDSIAALVTQAELDSDIKDQHVAIQARLLGRAIKIITPRLATSDTAILFTNQTRSSIGIGGPSEVIPGGRSRAHAAVIRVRINQKGGAFVRDGVKAGAKYSATVHKNQLALPWKKIEFFINWGQGVDSVADLIDEAVSLGVVTKGGGGYYSYGNGWEDKIHGIMATTQYLRDNREVFDILENEVGEMSNAKV